MIKIEVKEHEGLIKQIKVFGHAESAEYGKDLVCAGVSAIGTGLLNALDELTPDTCDLQLNKDGEILIVVKEASEKNQIILATGLKQFETIEYSNKKYICIEKMEV